MLRFNTHRLLLDSDSCEKITSSASWPTTSATCLITCKRKKESTFSEECVSLKDMTLCKCSFFQIMSHFLWQRIFMLTVEIPLQHKIFRCCEILKVLSIQVEAWLNNLGSIHCLRPHTAPVVPKAGLGTGINAATYIFKNSFKERLCRWLGGKWKLQECLKLHLKLQFPMKMCGKMKIERLFGFLFPNDSSFLLGMDIYILNCPKIHNWPWQLTCCVSHENKLEWSKDPKELFKDPYPRTLQLLRLSIVHL